MMNQTNHEPKKQLPRKGGLGRGLASLLPTAFEETMRPTPGAPANVQPASAFKSAMTEQKANASTAAVKSVAPVTKAAEDRPYFFANLEDLSPNPNQPRKHFDAQALDELAQSIKTHGLLSPIVVRRNGLSFEIVAGERRWRACKMAGLTKVPVILKEVGEKAQYQLALIENIQRANLTPVEEALGYEHMMDAYGWTQEKVAEQIGKDRATVANALRLLKLPPSVLDLLAEGKVSTGHCKALLSLQDPARMKEIAKKIELEGWSVRMVENLVQQEKAKNPKPMTSIRRDDPQLKSLERRLEGALKMKITLRGNGSKGTLQLGYGSTQELNRVVDALMSAHQG